MSHENKFLKIYFVKTFKNYFIKNFIQNVETAVSNVRNFVVVGELNFARIVMQNISWSIAT